MSHRARSVRSWRRPGPILLTVLLSAGLWGARGAQTAPPQPEFIPGQYIVVLNEEAGEPGAAAAGLAHRFGLIPGFIYRSALSGFSCRATEAAAAALRRHPAVAAVAPDVRVRASAQTLPTGVVDIAVDAIYAIDGADDAPDVDIAIIDTGVGPHPDLLIAGGVDFSGFGSYADGNIHGTHVAGIAAAIDNDSGVVGTCPGARIWSVRVLGPDGSGALSTVAAEVDWVAATRTDADPDNDIEVADMSLGAYYPPIYEALFGDPLKASVAGATAAGVHIAVAAGNDSSDSADYIPARYNSVICTSAMSDFDGAPGGDSLAWFSNYGPAVDVIAPGDNIYSTEPGGAFGTHSGTSMASPHTAGAVAAYLVANPGATPAALLFAFRSNGEPAPAGGWPGDPDGIAERAINLPALMTGGGGEPPPSFDFTATVSTDRAIYRRGQLVTVNIRATDTGGAGVAGAATFTTVTDPRGVSLSRAGTTAPDGRDAFGILTSRSDATGTWTVQTEITAGGITRIAGTTFRLRK